MIFNPSVLMLLGGLVVGFAAGRALLAKGAVSDRNRDAGNDMLLTRAHAGWKALWLVGIVAGGMGLAWVDPSALPMVETVPVQLMVGAGLLAGFGARIVGG